MTPQHFRIAALLLLACSATASAEQIPEWPGYRGPTGDGHAVAANLPVDLNAPANLTWKTPIPGVGWSTPVVLGEQIWMTTATPDGTSLRAVCVNRRSGAIERDIEVFRVEKPIEIHKKNSHASPTPVIEPGRLYVHYGTNGTAAVDASTGTILWTHTLQKIKHENGAGGTPVLFGNRLIFDCDGSDQQYIVALDTASGAVAWKTERSGERNPEPQLKKAYGSPTVTEVDGRPVLLSTGADWLYAYDPEDGRELWKQAYGVLGFSVVPRPIVGHGMAYVSTSFMQPELLAVKLPSGNSLPEIVWRVKKSVPNIPSPLLVGDEILMVSDKGVATCVDAASGEVHYSERLGGNFCSSPLYADGRIWIGNREGQTFVLAPGKNFLVEATNQLDGEIMATPIAVGPALFIRTDKAVYRIEDR